MDGIEHFDEKRNLARVMAGFKGRTDYFANLVKVPERHFVDGYPPEVAEKLTATPIPTIPIGDVWVTRYPNAKMK